MTTMQEFRRSNGKRAQNIAADRLRYAPFQVKQDLADQNYEALQRGMKNAIDREEPWALQFGWNVLLERGSNTAEQALLASIGVATLAELLAYVTSGRQFQQLTEGELSPETALEDAVEVVRMCLRDAPHKRAEVLARLGSEAEVVGDASGS